MLKLDINNNIVLLSSNTTDTRGEGLYIDLKSKFSKLGYLYNNCSNHSYTLHILILIFSNSIAKCIGIGGVKNINTLQLLITYYALEQEFEYEI